MIGRSLAALRARLGLTQVQMAESLRVGETTYVAYEAAGRTPCERALDTLLELVRASAPELEERFAAKVEDVRARRRRESLYAGARSGAQTSEGARVRRQRSKAAAAKRARLIAIRDVHAKLLVEGEGAWAGRR